MTKPPSTETEAALLAIWLDVLPVDAVGVDDNFFQVGGHSLTATKVVARARAHFAVELPLHVIFAKSTVESMAADIDDRVAAADGVGAGAEDSSEDLSQLLDDLESLSDEEAARLLSVDVRTDDS